MKSAGAVPAAVRSRAELVDEYGELERQISSISPQIARAAELRREMESWYANEDPAGVFTVEGEAYSVQVGAKAKQRTITGMRKLYKALGLTRFLDLCTFPLGALDKLAIDTSKIVTEFRGGHRTIKSVAKVAALRIAA